MKQSYTFTETIYTKDYDPKKLIFVGDIGGTNSNFAFVEYTNATIRLIVSIHLKSGEITNFEDAVSWVLHYSQQSHGLLTTKACFAGAGRLEEASSIILTNLSWNISIPSLLKKTSLTTINILNDFQAVGYGIDHIDSKYLHPLYRAKKYPVGIECNHSSKIIIGAGTGLGKSLMAWNKSKKQYVALASEGGHADLPVYNQEEYNLLDYLIIQEKIESPIEWEDILSGRGICRLYRFYSNNPSKQLTPAFVFDAYKDGDVVAQQAIKLFFKFYARVIKNMVLDAKADGGVYIAGGIAAKNKELFKQDCFINEFLNSKTMKPLLEKTSIFIITDYNVSLYGAAAFYFIANR